MKGGKKGLCGRERIESTLVSKSGASPKNCRTDPKETMENRAPDRKERGFTQRSKKTAREEKDVATKSESKKKSRESRPGKVVMGGGGRLVGVKEK